MVNKVFKITFLLFVIACQNQTPQIKKSSGDEKIVEKKIDTTYFDFINITPIDIESLKSHLEEKTKKLYELEQQFKTVRLGEIKKQSSKVYNAVLGKSELCFSSKNCYKISNVKQFENSISEINYAKIEGLKSENGVNLKAEIEELIFFSPEDAESLLSYIRHVRSIEYFWDTLDKTASNIFRESNKVYFIRMKNKYTKRYPLVISEMMKN